MVLDERKKISECKGKGKIREQNNTTNNNKTNKENKNKQTEQTKNVQMFLPEKRNGKKEMTKKEW